MPGRTWIEVSHDEDHGGAGWEFGTCLWSPTRKRDGTTWPWWECLLDVRAGDRVIHIRDQGKTARFVGTSTAASDGHETKDRPPAPDEWDHAESFYRVRLRDYTPLGTPLPLVDFFARYDRQLREIYERNRSRPRTQKELLFFVIQGGRLQCQNGAYLAPASDEVAGYILSKRFTEDDLVVRDELNVAETVTLPPALSPEKASFKDMFSALRIGLQYTRPQLAEEWGYAGHSAISRGVFTPKGQPLVILFVTRIKQTSLPQYSDYLSDDTLYWEGEDGHGNDDRIINASVNGDEIHLFYRVIHHTPFEYKGPLRLLSYERHTDKPSTFVFRLVHDMAPEDDIESCKPDLDTVADATEREALTKARRGQGKFRQSLLELWSGRCAVTSVPLPEILRASHIRPWRKSTNAERLDPFNGLLLLPQYDLLFDKGLVSFEDDGALIVSKAISAYDFALLGINASDRLRFVRKGHRRYLGYHRTSVLVR